MMTDIPPGDLSISQRRVGTQIFEFLATQGEPGGRCYVILVFCQNFQLMAAFQSQRPDLGWPAAELAPIAFGPSYSFSSRCA